MRFKDYLLEFRNSEQGQMLDIGVLQDFVSNSNILSILINTPEGNNTKALIVLEHKLDTNNTFIILTHRDDKQDIVGYLWLYKIIDDIWQVRDAGIYENYQNKGLGTELYIKLIQNGYKLINGFSLSDQAKKLWNKLKSIVTVGTYNIKTSQISEYSNLPETDPNAKSYDDNKQIYFWIAYSNEIIKENISTDEKLNQWYIEWLNNKRQIPGSYRSMRYSNLGDF
jgi:hypothetical protein